MKETENINKETEDETEVENLKQKIIKTIIKKTIDEFNSTTLHTEERIHELRIGTIKISQSE